MKLNIPAVCPICGKKLEFKPTGFYSIYAECPRNGHLDYYHDFTIEELCELFNEAEEEKQDEI